MSIVWTFSSSSQSLLKRCLDVAAPLDESNKWVKKFKLKEEKPDVNDEEKTLKNKNTATGVSSSDPKPPEVKNLDVTTSENYEEFYESLEHETALKFDLLREKCLENPDLLSKLPEKLSTGAIEKTCKLLFDKTDVDVVFLDMFYQKFLLALVKSDYSLFSLDILVKSTKAHPTAFEKLLRVLLKDLAVPSKVLQDLYQNMDDDKRIKFINRVIETDLTADEFQHSLFTIHAAYKNCKKDLQIQNSVQDLLIKYSEKCSNDKNYGKLLLAFLQEQKNAPTNDFEKLEKVIEMHKTPFKKPCLNIFKEILSKCKKLQ